MSEKQNRFFDVKVFQPQLLTPHRVMAHHVMKCVLGDLAMQKNTLQTGRRCAGFFRSSLAVWMSLSAAFTVLPTVSWAADSSSFEQHVESAKGYMNASQWTYANYEWRAALAEDPGNVDANIGLAETLLQSNLVPDALTHLETVRQSIHKLSLELEYAKVLEASQRYSDAKDVYMMNLKRVPMELQSFTKLLTVSPKLPQTEQRAVRDYLQDLASDASKSAHDALARQNYEEAARNFAISTQVNPNITDGNDYALTLLLQQRYDDALKAFDQMKRIGYDAWELYANSAFVVLGQGNPFGAVRNMEKAIGLCQDPSKKPQLYNDLGFLYENQNRWQKARSAYSHAVELDPSYSKAKMNLAYAYQKDMAYEDSIKTYQSILAQEPNNTKVLNQMGFVYELENKPRQALQAYKKAMDISPESQEGYYNLAILYKKLGKMKEADLAYKQMMDMEFNRMEMAQKKQAAVSAVSPVSSVSRVAMAKTMVSPSPMPVATSSPSILDVAAPAAVAMPLDLSETKALNPAMPLDLAATELLRLPKLAEPLDLADTAFPKPVASVETLPLETPAPKTPPLKAATATVSSIPAVNPGANRAAKEMRDGQKGLLQYVDVFFSPLTTSASSND
jgi:tetratricopeptide (TPR) repeat protein